MELILQYDDFEIWEYKDTYIAFDILENEIIDTKILNQCNERDDYDYSGEYFYGKEMLYFIERNK